MADYIDIPIETDPEVLSQEAFDFLQSVFPDWVPNDGNLETVLIEANARMTAEARDVASAVPTDIFRYYGTLVGITPINATFASSTATFTAIDNLGYTIFAGTQIGIRTSGDVLIPFETLTDAVIPPGNTSINAVEIQALEAGVAASSLSGTVELIDTLDFISTITLDAPTAGGQDEEDDDVYLGRLVTKLQLLAPRPILARDFAIFAQDIAGVGRAVALDGYYPLHNLLTANQSSLETDTTGWVADVNCSITRDTTQTADGVASLRLSSTASGTMSARTTPGTTPVTPGEQLTATAQFKAGASVRGTKVAIRWLTSGDTTISDSFGASINDATATWTQASVTAIAPATAAKAVVIVQVVSTGGASELHYVDKIMLRYGDSTTWAIGGTAAYNNERMVAVAVVDADGEAVSSGVKAEVDAYLQSLREVNFVVNVMDPTYTTIDVQFTAKALTGWTTADVDTATEQAITDYLSPKNWGLPDPVTIGDVQSPSWINATTVRYLELAQVINQVGGVDYIVSLTLRKGVDAYAAADVILNGPVPLPRPGVISGTVTS